MKDTQAQKNNNSRNKKPLWRRILWRIVRIALLVYMGMAVGLCLFESWFIYHPSSKISSTPDKLGLAYEEVAFNSDDGVKLTGWYVPARRSRGVLLFCHGNAGNISDRLVSIAIFNSLDLDVFIFDYRGYGGSDGKTTEKGTYLDALAAWRYLTEDRNVPAQRIIVFGRSLGGSVAAQLAGVVKPEILILESTFSSVADMAGRYYPIIPWSKLLRYKYNTVGHLQSVSCPTMVIHSREDGLIPIDLGRRVFKAAGEPKTFLEIRGGHNNGFMVSSNEYWKGLGTFLDKHLGD